MCSFSKLVGLDQGSEVDGAFVDKSLVLLGSVKHGLVGFLQGLQVSFAVPLCNRYSHVCYIQCFFFRIHLGAKCWADIKLARVIVVLALLHCKVVDSPCNLVVDALVELFVIDLKLHREFVPFLIDLRKFCEHVLANRFRFRILT